jgi:adenosylcobinamide-phosphate synthase
MAICVHRYDNGMSFISILLALLIEQAKPLPAVNPVHGAVRHWVRWVVRNFDAGLRQHGWLTWLLAVAVPAMLVMAVHWLLVWWLGWLAAMVWGIAILYATLGFRQFSHYFTAVRDALHAGDDEQARRLLAQWMRKEPAAVPTQDVVRQVIEHSVISAHRHVFGVFSWYALGAALGWGPAGAVLYRISDFFHAYTHRKIAPGSHPVSEATQTSAAWLWRMMDWLPARITALSFAFVGSFEEAIDSWRLYEAQTEQADNTTLIIAATAGAVKLQLGRFTYPIAGAIPRAEHLRSVVGLVWRTVVVWMVFLALLSLAKWLG